LHRVRGQMSLAGDAVYLACVTQVEVEANEALVPNTSEVIHCKPAVTQDVLGCGENGNES